VSKPKTIKTRIGAIFLNILKCLGLFLLILFFIPNELVSPIQKKDFIRIDSNSFWYYPWGESGVHKGIDIFCAKKAEVVAPIYGFIAKKGYGTISGNYVYLLGPKLRLYYFAHLDTILVDRYSYVSSGEVIARAGNTGNAQNSPTHLHFSIETILPYFWLRDKTAMEGHKKMYYLDPTEYLPKIY
jgi:peptidoglycan LD-endopeptidase LytH